MIEVQKVSLQIKKAKILENVDFTCQKGQICGVVGRNGSGKTMLMKVYRGFVKADFWRNTGRWSSDWKRYRFYSECWNHY